MGYDPYKKMTYLHKLYTTAKAAINRHPMLFCLAIVAFAALLAFTRRPDIFVTPQFWAEDGAVWYTDAYQNGFWSTILKPYPEYLAIPQRILVFISTWFPFGIAPLFLNVSGLLLQLIPVFLLASGRLKHIIPSRLLAGIIGLLVVAQPNSAEVFSSFANAQWHLALAALLILISPVVKGVAWRVFDITVIAAACLSGPAAILLVPVAGLYWWFNRTTPARNNVFIVGLLAFLQVISIVFISTYHRSGEDPAFSFFAVAKIIGGQIFAGGLLGQDNITMFYNNRIGQYIFVAVCLGLVLYAAVRGPLWLKLLNMYAALQISVLLISSKNPTGFTIDILQGLTNPTGGQRYWYIPIAAWLTTLLWISWYARQTLVRGIAVTLVALWLLVGIHSDWALSPMVDYQFKKYAAMFEATPQGQPLDIPINPSGWKMTLYKK